MRTVRTIAVVAVLAGIMVLPGCFLSNLRKKKPAVPPSQAQAPTVTTPAAPVPEQPKPSPPPPVSGEPTRPKPEVTPPTTTAEKPKPKRPRTRVAKKTPPPAPAVQPEPEPAQPPKTVVPEGGVTPPAAPQLSASMGHDAAIHQQMTTAQLLEATDYNLKGISRALNGDEQAMVQHIRSFMQQSRDATKEGDLERAYNLAMKAHLLSDELVKGR